MAARVSNRPTHDTMIEALIFFIFAAFVVFIGIAAIELVRDFVEWKEWDERHSDDYEEEDDNGKTTD